MKPILIDGCCGAGGLTRGYQNAGFYVIGVDIEPMPNYVGDEFYQDDALDFIDKNWRDADGVHISPPCQLYSKTHRINKQQAPDLIAPARELLQTMTVPWVIENVPDSPLIDPVELCGAMFGLFTYRHRLFESSFDLEAPVHPEHRWRNAKMGRMPKPGEFMHVVGHYSGAKQARVAMGIDWMTREELAEAVPPAYSEYVGIQLLNVLNTPLEVAA